MSKAIKKLAEKKRKEKIFFLHEAMDRTYVQMDSFNSFILDHPTITKNKKLFKQAGEISSSLHDLYVTIGQKLGKV